MNCLAKMRKPQLDQFWLLEEAGMSPAEILQSAICNAADLIQDKGELGVIAKGAIGDVLVVNGNPFESIQVFQQWDESCYAISNEG